MESDADSSHGGLRGKAWAVVIMLTAIGTLVITIGSLEVTGPLVPPVVVHLFGVVILILLVLVIIEGLRGGMPRV